MKAVRIQSHGGPEVLRCEDVPVASPGSEEVLVKIQATGVNYIDTYHRRGLYRVKLPFTLGVEAAGVVEAAGAEVRDVRVGDRVVYAGPPGACAEYAVVPAARVVKIPEGVDVRTAAAVFLQGMTAHYLTHNTYPLKAGDTALVHAAAGGVGLLLDRMAKMRGARVIGTVSTEEKARLAREAGADEVILYTREDFEAGVKRLTGGRGVQVVYDGVGKATFDKDLNCLLPRGYLVLFGQSSGPVPPVDPQILSEKGSLFLTRPTLGHYTATRDELLWRAGEVLAWARSGQLPLRIDHVFPLADAAAAHQRLESRQSAGKILLTPS
jgi:NADPH:quinone reductase